MSLHLFVSPTAPLAPVIDTQKTLAYDELFLCWRLPQDSAPAWHFSVEYQRKAGAAAATWGGIRSSNAATAWQRLDEVRGTSAVVDRLQINSVYVLRVRGCNKAGFGEYSEEVYLHTPPAPGEMHELYDIILYFFFYCYTSFITKLFIFLKQKRQLLVSPAYPKTWSLLERIFTLNDLTKPVGASR